jgi:hypothetical protein
MTCAEFQRVLPYIIETGGNADEEQHLRDCQICSDLVADLKYIADQAKLLVPMEEPSPRVWEGIRGSLEREGLVKPARARGRLLGFQHWGPLPWVASLAALALILFGVFLFQRAQVEPSTISEPAGSASVSQPAVSLQTVSIDRDDDQLLQQMTTSRPAMMSNFRDNLKQVNAAIADARQAVQQNPDDSEARESLIRAYQQKAMLYEMATRSLQ